MPLRILRYVGLLAVGVACVSCATFGTRRRPRPDVHVTIACTDGPVNVTVNGWLVRKTSTGTVRIRFTGGGSGITSVTVSPKDPNRWDFSPAPTGGSYTLQSNGDLLLTVNPGASGLYRYNVAGTCTSNGVSNSITIDPDIVVN